MSGGKPLFIVRSWAWAIRYRPSLGQRLALTYLSFTLRRFRPGILPGILLGSGAQPGYQWRVMTRSSIELAVQVFLVSLVIVFTWAFYKLMVLIGWL